MKLEEQIAVMQHFARGGKVEYRYCANPTTAWGYIPDPSWDWRKCEYRIKPEPLKPMRRWFIQVGGHIGYVNRADAENVARGIGGIVVEMVEVLP